MKTVKRLLKAPASSFFLFGPRGTGKSQWTQTMFPNALFIDLLDPRRYRELSARPESLIELINGNLDKTDIVLDEIQKIPQLLSVVHSLIEEHRNLRFILTGSSARKLRRGGVDLLGGRALNTTMHPFLAAELGNLFSLENALQTGLIPLIAASQTPKETLNSYLDLYIREEVYQEGLVRSINNFARFLEAISFSQGTILNLSAVSRECSVERKSVEAYCDILEDLLIAWRLPVFSVHTKRSMAKQPKFFFFDVGVYRCIRPAGPLDNAGIIPGISLETLVAQHLHAWCKYENNENKLFYWRTHTGLEVDFIIYGTETFAAIEVKSTARVRPEDLKGLKAFLKDYPTATGLILYRGTDKLKIGNILCVPCEEFLKGIVPGNPLPV